MPEGISLIRKDPLVTQSADTNVRAWKLCAWGRSIPASIAMAKPPRTCRRTAPGSGSGRRRARSGDTPHPHRDPAETRSGRYRGDPAVFAGRYRYRAVAKSVLKPEAWPLWLGEKPADTPQLKALLAPYPSEDIICWPVRARVGNVKNNDLTLIEPITLQ